MSKARPVINIETKEVYNSIRQAEQELEIYNITRNCQGKQNYVNVLGKERVYCNFMYYDLWLELNK